jgi:TonB family protein
MKKRILIFSLVLVTLSFAAFSFINSNNSKINQKGIASNSLNNTDKPLTETKTKEPLKFFYFVSPRFESIKKSDVNKARSIRDFISEEDDQQIASVYSTEVILIKNDIQTDIREYGTGETLTDKQIELLQSVDYSKHFLVRTNYKDKSKSTTDSEDHFFSPHYTVVPEKQAAYMDGNDALIKYLKDNKSKDTDFIDSKTLQFVKVSFTITTEGRLKQVNLDRSTGYQQLDFELLELIKNIPGQWKPAENANGEKVEQELVFSFGLADAC